jgi:SagB-type dehydrogenase family enzyme
MKSQVFLTLLPAALLGLWLLWGLFKRKKQTRFTINNVVSLILLFYFLLVTGTGIFWVAVQELPVFDWHYLPGYILLILGLLHVALHWKTVAVFLRQKSPGALKTKSGNEFKGWIPIAGYALLFLLTGSTVFVGGMKYASGSITIVSVAQENILNKDILNVKEQALSPTLIKENGKTISVSEFYHLGSSYPAQSKLEGITWKMKPDVYKSYKDKLILPLADFEFTDGNSIIDAYTSWRKGVNHLETSSISKHDLSNLLYHTYGVNKILKLPGRSFDLRAAASAGALYPVNIYVAVNRVEGLDRGIYYYHMKQKTFVQIKQGAMDSQLEAAAGSPYFYSPAAATIIMTSTFGRSGFKYKDRCYRYANMDTGHAIYNLVTSASSMGYASPVVARFDDQKINSLLGLDTKEECALVLIPFGKAAPGPAIEKPEPRFVLDSAKVTNQTQATFLELVHGKSSFTRTKAWTTLSRKGKPKNNEILEAGDIQLPEPVLGKRLLQSIRDRRSIRKYSAAAIELEELSALCVAAMGAGEDGDPFLSVVAPLNLYMVINNVNGVLPGIYKFNPINRSIRPLKKGAFHSQCFEACYKQEFCEKADVLFITTATWKDILYPDGDRGYRYACINSGMCGEGIYLQATALDIGVCGVGAFLDFEVAGLIDINTKNEVVLYLIAIGK